MSIEIRFLETSPNYKQGGVGGIFLVVDKTTGNNVTEGNVISQAATQAQAATTINTIAGHAYEATLAMPAGPGTYPATVTATIIINGVSAGTQSATYSSGLDATQQMVVDFDSTGIITKSTGIAPSPTPTPSGGGTTPPPPPATGSFPPTPDSINPVDWLKWLGQVIQWFANQMWIGLVGVIEQIWAIILTSIRPYWNRFFVGWIDFWNDLRNFFAWLSTVHPANFAKWWATSSKSVSNDLATGATNFYKNIASTSLAGMATEGITKDPLLNPIYQAGAAIAEEITTPTNPDSVQALIADLDQKATAALLTAMVLSISTQVLPTINMQAPMQYALSFLESRGIFNVMRGTLQPYLDANVNRNLNYKLNTQYQNVIPDLGSLNTLLAQGRMSVGLFNQLAPQVSGIRADYLTLMHSMAQRVPSFQEFIIYNRRNPDTAYDLTTLGDLTGQDMTRYEKVFLESQYSEISMRYLQAGFDVLNLSEAQITELARLTGADPRPNAILGASPLQLMVQIVMARKGQTVALKALGEKEKLYIQGLITLDEVKQVLSAAYASPEAQKYYLTYIQDALKYETMKPKNFTYSQLIKYAEAGVDVTTFAPADLKAAHWDDVHVTATMAYIKATLTGKGVTLTGQPPS